MADKTNFWTVFVFPWRPKNSLRLGLYIFVGQFLILASIWLINFLVSGQVPTIPLWCLPFAVVLPAFFILIFRIVGMRVEKLSEKLPEGALLRSHCMVVHGIMESAGLAQINRDQLIIRPLIGGQITIPLSQIIAITEHHWYNGRPYLGSTVFFKIKVPDTVSDKWRLGFGVEDADAWRNLLYAQSSHAT